MPETTDKMDDAASITQTEYTAAVKEGAKDREELGALYDELYSTLSKLGYTPRNVETTIDKESQKVSAKIEELERKGTPKTDDKYTALTARRENLKRVKEKLLSQVKKPSGPAVLRIKLQAGKKTNPVKPTYAQFQGALRKK